MPGSGGCWPSPAGSPSSDDLRGDDNKRPADPYDSHPTLAARVAYIATVPDRPAPGDTRPATALLREPERVSRAVTAWVNTNVLKQVPAELYEFDDVADPAPYARGRRALAASLSTPTLLASSRRY